MDPLGPAEAGISSSLRIAANSAASTDPRDRAGMIELLHAIKEVDAQLRTSARLDESKLCELAIKMTEGLISQMHPSIDERLDWINHLLRFLASGLGVELSEEWNVPPRAPKPLAMPTRASAAGLGDLRMKKEDNTRLGDILIQMSFLKAQDVERALRVQQERGCRLGEAMVMLGLLSQRGLEAALRVQERRRSGRG